MSIANRTLKRKKENEFNVIGAPQFKPVVDLLKQETNKM